MDVFLTALYIFIVVVVFLELYKQIFKQWKEKEQTGEKGIKGSENDWQQPTQNKVHGDKVP